MMEVRAREAARQNAEIHNMLKTYLGYDGFQLQVGRRYDAEKE